MLAATAAAPAPAEAAAFEVTAIDHIQINASNAAKSAEWYRNAFGLHHVLAGAMTPDSEEIAHVGTSDSLLISFRKLSPPGKIDHIGFRSNLPGAAVRKDLESRGFKFAAEDKSAAPGQYLIDPDGVRIQIGPKTTIKPGH
jgi:catechol 2,3-dioxygenase-like lactoylglutathione lyase family enzyme